jgi:glycosyltransferase involved in cell wall biosynthesis
VTVVVPTRNSLPALRPCLESLRGQTYGDLEVIVVDNYSTDGTPAVAQELADQVVTLGPERSAQRNAGAKHGAGSFLFFIDSDMIVEGEVVSECVALATRPDVVSVVVPEVSFGDGLWARSKALERSCYAGDDTVEAARFFGRDVFEQVSGFDEALPSGPEDWDLDQRVRALGGLVARTESVIHHDEGTPRLHELMAKKFYYGRGMADYIRRHPAAARQQLRVLRPAFRRHWKRLARDPLTAGAMFVMKACEFGAGGAGLLTQLVETKIAARAVRTPADS